MLTVRSMISSRLRGHGVEPVRDRHPELEEPGERDGGHVYRVDGGRHLTGGQNCTDPRTFPVFAHHRAQNRGRLRIWI